MVRERDSNKEKTQLVLAQLQCGCREFIYITTKEKKYKKLLGTTLTVNQQRQQQQQRMRMTTKAQQ